MNLTKSQAKQIRALKRMKDEDIDFAIIPELTGDERFFVGSFTDDQAGGCPKKYQ